MPPLRTTIGQVIVNESLPEDLRDYSRVLDNKGMQGLLQQLVNKGPDAYREATHGLLRTGRDTAYTAGNISIGLKHLQTATSAKESRYRLQKEIDSINNDSKLTDDQKSERIVHHVIKGMQPLEDAVMKESLAEDNPIALLAKSGARGNPTNLKSLRAGDSLYSDHRDRPIPMPIMRSYSEGLLPAEYWAGTYGARRGVIATKFETSDAGFFAKQLTQLAHRLVVTKHDEDNYDGTPRGLPVDTDDPDNSGALLEVDTGPYKRNTILTPKILAGLSAEGIKRLLIRSPSVRGTPEGGLYARDVGVREKGGIAPIGDIVGIPAAQAHAEPLSQSQLSAKHSGGITGKAGALTGFKAINQLIQVPKQFKGGATHAEVDGRVDGIEAAPAGGYFVTINQQQHFIKPGHDMRVQKGDQVEAGDVISDGVPNPAEITKHKGIGEGRRYFTYAIRRAFNDSGLSLNRRNAELISHGLINHVRLHDEIGDGVPGDVVTYSSLASRYEPREDAVTLEPKKAVGLYLEKPILHHTIGTKIRNSMLPDLDRFGVKQVTAHPEPPGFEPEMIRGMANIAHDPDWMTRMIGSNLKKTFLGSVHRGGTSDESGTSYVPALARGVNFGQGKVKGWDPNKPLLDDLP